MPYDVVERPPLYKLLLSILLGVTLTAVVLMLAPPRRSATA